MSKKYLDGDGLQYLWSLINAKVDQGSVKDNDTQESVPGLLMSLNDFNSLTPQQQEQLSENAFILCYEDVEPSQ